MEKHHEKRAGRLLVLAALTAALLTAWLIWSISFRGKHHSAWPDAVLVNAQTEVTRNE